MKFKVAKSKFPLRFYIMPIVAISIIICFMAIGIVFFRAVVNGSKSAFSDKIEHVQEGSKNKIDKFFDQMNKRQKEKKQKEVDMIEKCNQNPELFECKVYLMKVKKDNRLLNNFLDRDGFGFGFGGD